MEVTIEKIIALAKRRGLVYPTSEIYGGLTSSYDYGPYGVELLKNIKEFWWREFIQQREDMVGLDSQIMLHPQTWVASGHVASFSDPMVEDKVTHKRYRADHLIENELKKFKQDILAIDLKDKASKWPNNKPITQEQREEMSEKLRVYESTVVENLSLEEMAEFIRKYQILSPEGNEVTAPKKFNLLFETHLGVVEGEKSTVYLRGETAQGIFSNFKNVIDSSRVKLPFGIGQIGKSFRNEITSGQFIFRTLEFEQAEIEYFFDPDNSDWEKLFKSWQDAMWHFVTKTLGIHEEKLRWRKHTDKERSHYSKDTYDLEYQFSFGWKELWGIAYRTDYDLKQHIEYSRTDLMYQDSVTGKKFVPHVIEPAVGLNRLLLMVLFDAYCEEEKRVVLKIHPRISPVKVAVFPLVSNKEDIVAKARTVYGMLKKQFVTAWDDRGNIGKRYLAQDEVGTPWCVTIDYDTLEDDAVTVRDRDSTKQERVAIGQLAQYFSDKLKGVYYEK
jgi:glycyl-tRNA synthetase